MIIHTHSNTTIICYIILCGIILTCAVVCIPTELDSVYQTKPILFSASIPDYLGLKKEQNLQRLESHKADNWLSLGKVKVPPRPNLPLAKLFLFVSVPEEIAESLYGQNGSYGDPSLKHNEVQIEAHCVKNSDPRFGNLASLNRGPSFAWCVVGNQKFNAPWDNSLVSLEVTF